ncbi:MAG: helix-hairpin-helix domain-containing protein [Phycisphaerales bacterium]|nr:general secretion pathway protein GspK [Phycisphaerales bacterium]
MMARRRSFATVLALWVIGLAAVLVLGIQSAGLGQAFGARDSLAEVRARWAAISGMEQMIAILADDLESPHPTDAYDVYDRMADASEGTIGGGRYSIEHWEGEERFDGPADAHARIHVARMSTEDLFWLPNMTEDLISRIVDWTDEDDEVSPLGAELGSYLSAEHPYEPRNGLMQTIEEMELILGILPSDIRDEDWNLNGTLDPNENDGDETWPPDDADGVLDSGWSGILTVVSAESTYGLSGQPRVRLGLGLGGGELVGRTGITAEQADVIAQYAGTNGATLEALINTPLRSLPGLTGQPIDAQAQPLTDEQIGLLLEEAAIDGPWLDSTGATLPGRININTVSEDTLSYAPGVTSSIADILIRERKGRPLGFRTVTDLLEVPGLTRGRVQELVQAFGFRSSVFVIRSVGIDEASGMRVELIATVDRSRLPVVIRDMVIR